MLPDDANPNGNVHGGTILRMIDDAGYIASARHCSKLPTAIPSACAVARIDRVDFARPMKIGQLAHVEAVPTFVSGGSSLEVFVRVTAEDLRTGAVQQTNEARLWYVRVLDTDHAFKWGAGKTYSVPPKLDVVHQVPPLRLSEAEASAGRVRYELQRQNRLEGLEAAGQPRTMQAPVLAHVVMPSDCYLSGTVFGGTIMKLMDSAGGSAAAAHCRTNVVTASIDAMNFEAPVFLGNLARFYAHPTFTSARSLEVVVHVEAEDLMTGRSWLAVSAHLTFVSLGPDGKSLPIRQLDPLSHQARADFNAGKQRYERRKALVERLHELRN